MPVDGCPSCDQWTDEAVWGKANPNLGVSLPTRYLREMVREALGKPAQQSVTKRLCFCIWTEGTGAWLDVAAFRACQDADGPAALSSDRHGYGGLDLASTTDLTAFAFLAPRARCPVEGHGGRCYDLRLRFWLPEANLAARVKRDHVPYDVWVRERWIALTPGNRIDRRAILATVVGLQAQLLGLGYDRWGMDELVRDLQDAGFDRGTEAFLQPVGQGFASLAGPAKRLEGDIAAGLVHHDGNPVLAWMVANAVAAQDAAGNVKPDRARSADKIDGVAAWCDALFAWAGAEPPARVSVYETRGLLTIGGRR
jgi:phage terminase large subunit-like protein